MSASTSIRQAREHEYEREYRRHPLQYSIHRPPILARTAPLEPPFCICHSHLRLLAGLQSQRSSLQVPDSRLVLPWKSGAVAAKCRHLQNKARRSSTRSRKRDLGKNVQQNVEDLHMSDQA